MDTLETEIYARLVMARLAMPAVEEDHGLSTADVYICGAMELFRAKHPGIEDRAENLLLVEGVTCAR